MDVQGPRARTHPLTVCRTSSQWSVPAPFPGQPSMWGGSPSLKEARSEGTLARPGKGRLIAFPYIHAWGLLLVLLYCGYCFYCSAWSSASILSLSRPCHQHPPLYLLALNRLGSLSTLLLAASSAASSGAGSVSWRHHLRMN